MSNPVKMGILSAQEARGHLARSFTYEKQWPNTLNYDLARSVGEYFNLNKKETDTIIKEVRSAVSNWEETATGLGVPSAQRRLMEAAFNLK